MFERVSQLERVELVNELNIRMIETVTIMSRSSSMFSMSFPKVLRLSTICISSSVILEPMHSKSKSCKLDENVL